MAISSTARCTPARWLSADRQRRLLRGPAGQYLVQPRVRATPGARRARCLRRRLKSAVHYLIDFRDEQVTRAARDRKVDGVICGHTHRPDHRMIGPILYVNDGDWVQSRTALVEEMNGVLRLVRWQRRSKLFAGCERRWIAMSRFYPVRQLFGPRGDRDQTYPHSIPRAQSRRRATST